MKLVLASNNAHKLAELRTLLGGLSVHLLAQGELGIDEAEEPHISFIENALAKARHAAAATGGAAIADDSGLCVEALGGAPGVSSAHYAPPPVPVTVPVPAITGERETRRRAQDTANNALLLQRLHGVAERGAQFVCTLVAVRHAADPQPLVATGRWPGQILMQPQGEGGFGYDPLMFIPALGHSVAQLAPALKNEHSHRALAAAQMRALLHDAWRV